MGYLSKKKKYERLNLFINISLFIVAVLSFCAFWHTENNFFNELNNWRIQLYFISLILLFISAYYRFILKSLGALLLVFINYFVIASSSNIINNISHPESTNVLNIIYQRNPQNINTLVENAEVEGADIIAVNYSHTHHLPTNILEFTTFDGEDNLKKSYLLSNENVLGYGFSRLGKNKEISYIKLERGEKSLILINLDFSHIKEVKKAYYLSQLADFIKYQDKPVAVIGNFGLPAWDSTFQNFLTETGLEVKNRMIMSDGLRFFNPLIFPSFNILGYKNMGVRQLKILDKFSSEPKMLFIRLEI